MTQPSKGLHPQRKQMLLIMIHLPTAVSVKADVSRLCSCCRLNVLYHVELWTSAGPWSSSESLHSAAAVQGCSSWALQSFAQMTSSLHAGWRGLHYLLERKKGGTEEESFKISSWTFQGFRFLLKSDAESYLSEQQHLPCLSAVECVLSKWTQVMTTRAPG